MKVLHVTSSLDPRGGGTTAVLAGMAPAQRRAGLNVTVLSTHARNFERAVADQLAERGVDVMLVGPVRTSLGLHHRLDARLRTAMANADVVHIHGIWEQVQHRAARLAQDAGTPYLISPHGMLAPWSLAQSRLKKKLYMKWRLHRNLARAAAIHFTTQAEREVAHRPALERPDILEPLGVATEEFENLPECGAFRRAHPQIGDNPLVVFLGRVHPGKGLEYLIPAIGSASPPHTRLAVVGPDSDGYVRTMRDLASSAGVSDRVIFTGMLSGTDRIAALSDADVFCLPSDHESFGIVVIEALASGTPVIISDRVGLAPEIAAEPVGEVVAPAVEPVAKALTHWLSDHLLRESAGSAGRCLARERYDWLRIGERWIKHYERLAQPAGQSAHSVLNGGDIQKRV